MQEARRQGRLLANDSRTVWISPLQAAEEFERAEFYNLTYIVKGSPDFWVEKGPQRFRGGDRNRE